MSGPAGGAVAGGGARGRDEAGAVDLDVLARDVVAAVRDVPLGAVLADGAEALAAVTLAAANRTGGAEAGERVGLLLGAAVALRGTAAAGDRLVARTAAGGRALAGADAFARAYGRGKAMTRQEALALLESAVPGGQRTAPG